jgi:hypothetical protein
MEKPGVIPLVDEVNGFVLTDLGRTWRLSP